MISYLERLNLQAEETQPEIDKNYLLLPRGVTNKVKPILVIVEGNSALVSISRIIGRNKYCILALQGKPSNVSKTGADKTPIEETLIASRIREVLRIKDSEQLSVDDFKERFSKIFLAFDSDVDGLHIAALSLNHLRTCCPGLFSRTETPLVSVILIPCVLLKSTNFNQTRSFFSDFLPKKLLSEPRQSGQYLLDKMKSKCIDCSSLITKSFF